MNKRRIRPIGLLSGTLLPGILLVFLMLFCLSACGYHFSGEGEGPKPGLKFIAIPVFENKTTESNVGAMIAGALRHEFNQKGNFRVVPVEEAEAVFKGTVKNINVVSVAHHPNEALAANRITLENRVYLTMDIRCEDKKTGKVLWNSPNFNYYKTYRLSVDPLLSPDALGEYESRGRAIEYLAHEMAVMIHDRFSSNF